MSKEVIFELAYREKGERKTKRLKFDFVSNYVFREYGGIFGDQETVRKLWSEVGDIQSIILTLKTTKQEGYKDKIEEYKSMIDEKSKQIIAIAEKDVASRRFELMKELFETNGIKDEIFQSKSFWDKCVEPSEEIRLLQTVIYKDIDLKKKIS